MYIYLAPLRYRTCTMTRILINITLLSRSSSKQTTIIKKYFDLAILRTSFNSSLYKPFFNVYLIQLIQSNSCTHHWRLQED